MNTYKIWYTITKAAVRIILYNGHAALCNEQRAGPWHVQKSEYRYGGSVRLLVHFIDKFDSYSYLSMPGPTNNTVCCRTVRPTVHTAVLLSVCSATLLNFAMHKFGSLHCGWLHFQANWIHPEDGGSTFFRNVRTFSQFTVQSPRKDRHLALHFIL